MNKYSEKYKFLISVLVGVILSVLVIILWLGYHRDIQEAKRNEVKETAQLVTIQFKKAVRENINQLQNLKRRLEVTNGNYFDYWEFDAGLIVQQDPSFRFIEWIDSNMIIQKVEPKEGNEEAIGLDLSVLDYRRNDWLQTKEDSITNFTHWLMLVQGENAFLVDAPVFYDGIFQGTITAGMDFTSQFDEIMQGLEHYHVEILDDHGTLFYQYGGSTKAEYLSDFLVEYTIDLNETNSGSWIVQVYPNQAFDQNRGSLGLFLNLGLGLALSILISVIFYFMQTSLHAQESSKVANETIRALINSSPMGIYSIDRSGKVIDFWNKAAEDMLGWTKEEAMGKFMPHVGKGWEKDFEHLMSISLKEGKIKNKEIVRYRKDGSPIHLRLNVGRIVDKKETDINQMLAIIEDITKEKEYKEQLENSVHEKEVLLAEVHHRVKNNLAIIVGLIELQKDGLQNEDLQIILKETQNRIYSISGVHELLYNTDSFSEITFKDYAKKLIERIRGMFEFDANRVDIRYDFDSRSLNINQAIPLGLLLNELVTNSFKHAFKDTANGMIFIQLKEKEGERIQVLYQDNGPGFDEEVFEQTHTLGVTLIKTLLDQLGAEYSIKSTKGFTFTFEFKVRGKGAHSNLEE